MRLILRRGRTALISAACIFLLSATIAQKETAAGSVPDEGRLHFIVTRDGASIGTHEVTFKRQGERTVIRSETDIEVGVLLVTVYKFEQRRTEIRDGDKLVFYDSWTDNNGDILTAHAEATSAGLKIDGSGGATLADGSLIPTTYWDIATVDRDRLIEGSDGRVIDISVQPIGSERLDLRSGPVETTRYQLSGGVERDLWYDTQGVWRKMEFRVDDGSVIAYVARP